MFQFRSKYKQNAIYLQFIQLFGKKQGNNSVRVYITNIDVWHPNLCILVVGIYFVENGIFCCFFPGNM